MYDAIVVGGGPAGLSAALTLGRVRRTTLVLDSGDYRNATAEHAHNLFTRDGTPPAELRWIARAQLDTYPTVEIESGVAEHAEPIGDGFEVRLADGPTRSGRRLLLATGLADELPDIAGLGDLWGRSVFHCPYCHGYEVRDQAIAVIGSGPRYADLALHLRRLSDDVVLCSNGPANVDQQTARRLDEYASSYVRSRSIGWSRRTAYSTGSSSPPASRCPGRRRSPASRHGSGHRCRSSSAARASTTTPSRWTTSAGPVPAGSTPPATWGAGRRCPRRSPH